MYNDHYFCTGCRRIYDEESAEVYVQKEYMGECHGAPAYDEVEYIRCPYCGSERYEEVEIEEIVSLYNEKTDACESLEHKCKELLAQDKGRKKNDKATARAYIYR